MYVFYIGKNLPLKAKAFKSHKFVKLGKIK